MEDFHRRTGGRLMNLMTSDENPAYAEAIREVYGETVQPRRTGRPGRPAAPYKRVPKGLGFRSGILFLAKLSPSAVESLKRVEFG